MNIEMSTVRLLSAAQLLVFAAIVVLAVLFYSVFKEQYKIIAL